MTCLFVKTYLFCRESSENTSHQVNVHVCDLLMPFLYYNYTLQRQYIISNRLIRKQYVIPDLSAHGEKVEDVRRFCVCFV